MSVVPPSEEQLRGVVGDEISRLVVRILRQYSGRGPTHAHTTFGRDSVHCVVGDSLTTSERTLADAGHEDGVIMARKQMQNAMRQHLVAEVEKLLERKVIAFMSDNHIDPDYGIESFILEPEPGDGRIASASATEPARVQQDERSESGDHTANPFLESRLRIAPRLAAP